MFNTANNFIHVSQL